METKDVNIYAREDLGGVLRSCGDPVGVPWPDQWRWYFRTMIEINLRYINRLPEQKHLNARACQWRPLIPFCWVPAFDEFILESSVGAIAWTSGLGIDTQSGPPR